MTGIRQKLRVSTEATSSSQSVEINIMDSFSPCQSPSLSPTSQHNNNVSASPPVSPTQAEFRRIFDSLEKEQQQAATRQSPSESPVDNEREAQSVPDNRQSPSLTSISSSNSTSDHEGYNDSNSAQHEERGTRHREASLNRSLFSSDPSNIVSDGAAIDSNVPRTTAASQPLHFKPPSEISEASLSSSVSGDILNAVARFDTYHNISPPRDSQRREGQLSPLDRIESLRAATIEDRADDILAEARTFAAGNTPVPSPRRPVARDSRTKEIIEKARTQASSVAKESPRMRTTEEVLQMAGAVLASSRSRSPGVSPQVSKDESSSPAAKEHHVSLNLPPLDRSRPDWDPHVNTATSSISDDEIAFQMNMIRNTPLHEVLSDDSLGMRRSFHTAKATKGGNTKDQSGSPTRALMEFFRGDGHSGPSSPDKRRINGLTAAFGCNSGAVENVFSNDEDESPLTKRISKMNPFACRGKSVLSVDDDDPDMSPASSMPQPSPAPVDPLPFSEASQGSEVDSRMPIWMTEHGAEVIESTPVPEDTFYTIGPSRAIVVHEIVRGDWTWCTAWSPDGGRLALATENHHLAVVETTASAVWRVRHDQRITRPVKNGTTHSIRSIAWGQNFIAIGGTGNAVSILAPIEPYPVLHTILDTGFVGSLSWRSNSAVLAIGSREDKCLVVNISAADGDGARHIQSTILETISRNDWVNAVEFSPGGTALAVGDQSGTLSLYKYDRKTPTDPPEISFLREFILGDSILAVEWSADGKWLYAGGEEFAVSVVDTTNWAVVHMIPRKKWVQFISSSNRGTHVAVGGVASEVSILDAVDNWEAALNIELKGTVPLSAKWHPKDQYLALTGQNNSVSVVETTNARHVYGHCLHSASPVLEVEFSPDGQMVVIGNEAGVVTFFCLEGSVFVTTYEMVLMSGESLSIRWSRNGQYVVIGTGDQVIIVTKISDRKMEKMPPGTSGFHVRKVIRGLGKVRSISIDDECRYIAVGGTTTQILDTTDKFACVREWKKRIVQCNAFSPDGTWLASIGRNENLTIYNTCGPRVDKWRIVFTLKAERAGLALAWGPTAVNGLQYLAYGGANNMITIIEIRTKEETWETVLEVPRACVIHDLDWNRAGMLAAAIGDGTVTIIDLQYLQSGWAMNEMDYTWQRQGITCLTEIRRNKGKNSMRTVRWMPSRDQSLIAIGGTDGSVEIVDLTERRRCRGFLQANSQRDMVVN